ncbi:MAG: hypothetical protein M0R74_00860 [Dehalococcoidia bacterium]|nr:hypothetical protein [Dehalococcoidia bacterium]
MDDGANVVWWALLLGGAIGGLSRTVLAGALELPYAFRDPTTGRFLVVPGFAGDLLLGPAAAFVVCGASAATYNFQGSFDARGFWGPFIASIPAGLASAQLLQSFARRKVEELEMTLFQHARGEQDA